MKAKDILFDFTMNKSINSLPQKLNYQNNLNEVKGIRIS